MDDIPHIKFIRGVVIVSNDNAEKGIDFLKEFNVEYYFRAVILLPEDENSLKPSQNLVICPKAIFSYFPKGRYIM